MFILKLLLSFFGVCNIDENLIESAYFVDTSIPDLWFNDKKIDALIYMFRFILSKQKIGNELKSVKLSQINFDLYSEKFIIIRIMRI